MAAGDVVTFPQGLQWFVIIEGEAEPVSSHESRDVAMEAGRELATLRECEHIVADFKPRGYAIQADLGAVTGGQASLYAAEKPTET